MKPSDGNGPRHRTKPKARAYKKKAKQTQVLAETLSADSMCLKCYGLGFMDACFFCGLIFLCAYLLVEFDIRNMLSFDYGSKTSEPSHILQDPTIKWRSEKKKSYHPSEIEYVGCFASEKVLPGERMYVGGRLGANILPLRNFAIENNVRYMAVARTVHDGHAFIFDHNIGIGTIWCYFSRCSLIYLLLDLICLLQRL